MADPTSMKHSISSLQCTYNSKIPTKIVHEGQQKEGQECCLKCKLKVDFTKWERYDSKSVDFDAFFVFIWSSDYVTGISTEHESKKWYKVLQLIIILLNDDLRFQKSNFISALCIKIMAVILSHLFYKFCHSFWKPLLTV